MSKLQVYANSETASGSYPPSNPSWYAVHVRSNFEKRVAGELVAKGMESYLPVITKVHDWKDRKKRIDVPLFPGYIFTRFFDTPAIRLTVLRTVGAARILGCQESIEAIPESETESIQRLLLVLSVEVLSRSVSTEVNVRDVEAVRATPWATHQPASFYNRTQ